MQNLPGLYSTWRQVAASLAARSRAANKDTARSRAAKPLPPPPLRRAHPRRRGQAWEAAWELSPEEEAKLDDPVPDDGTFGAFARRVRRRREGQRRAFHDKAKRARMAGVGEGPLGPVGRVLPREPREQGQCGGPGGGKRDAARGEERAPGANRAIPWEEESSS